LRGDAHSQLPPGSIPIAVAREKGLALVHDLAELRPDNRVLVLVPLVQFESDAAPPEPQMQAVVPAIS
jgi:hypothetical protein